MTKLLTQNSKMKKSLKNGIALFNFGLPAYQSRQGFKTCPMAGTCKKGCYASNGSYTWPAVKDAYEHRLALSQSAQFVEAVSKEINTKLKTADRKGNKLVIRVHDSGDYYNLEYTLKWFKVMQAFPTVLFYSYTKSVPMFKGLSKAGKIPPNLKLVYSEGGLADNKIDLAVDNHCRIFPDAQSLEQAGYLDVSNDDSLIFTTDVKKYGIVYHGAKSKKWSTVA